MKQPQLRLKYFYKNLTYNSGNPEKLRAAANNGNSFTSMMFNVANTYSTGILLDVYFQDAASTKFYILKDAKVGRGYNLDLIGNPNGMSWSDDMDLYTKVSTSSGTASLIMSCVSKKIT
tara:strand:+ start:110 stop:466 length:357 start_codon:yes stop_codon:yes gene_type:complete